MIVVVIIIDVFVFVCVFFPFFCYVHQDFEITRWCNLA